MKNTGKHRKAVEKTDYRRYRMKASELLKYGAAGSLLGCLICFLFYNSVYSLPLAAVITVLFLKARQKDLLRERSKRLLYHFGSFVGSLYSAMRSGYSIENGIALAGKELGRLYGSEDDMVRELIFMESRLRLNIPVEELFADLAKRSGEGDIELFSELISQAKRTGGNIGRLLENTRLTICEKIDTKRQIDRQLSSVKFEQKIMSIMPGAVILYMRFSFGGFMDSLYGSLTGALIMTGCLLVYAGAYLMGKKIVRIEV